MSTNDGGPAFPFPSGPEPRVDQYHDRWEGMSLRDWFAGNEELRDFLELAEPMTAALAGPKPEGNWQSNSIAWLEWDAKARARIKYIRADAMLKVREGGAK